MWYNSIAKREEVSELEMLTNEAFKTMTLKDAMTYEDKSALVERSVEIIAKEDKNIRAFISVSKEPSIGIPIGIRIT